MRRGTSLLVLTLTSVVVAGSVLAVCGTPEPSPSPAPVPAAKRPNVVLVVWDTVRADRMSLYGYAKPTTPRLDALAKESVVYDRATSTGMWTLPGHAGMFTGLYETTHGATGRSKHTMKLDDAFETLAEKLGADGYDTFAFSANIVAGPLANLLQGFTTAETTYPTAAVKKGRYMQAARQATMRKLIPTDASTELSPAFAGNTAERWGKADFKDAAPVAHRALMDWLGERPGQDKPFFAFLNLMEAHSPRVPTIESRRKVMSDEAQALALTTDVSVFAENEYIVGKRDYTPAQLDAMGGVYDAALVDLDDATGDLVDDLRAKGLLDDTLLIVSSDHGEALGEHRRLEHRFSVYDQLLHVPLLVRYPAKMPPARVSDRVTTADVYATVLDAAGVAPSTPSFSTSLVGRTTYDRFVFAQMTDPFASQLKSIREAYPGLSTAAWERTYCAVYEGATKLIYATDGGHQMFDVGSDPAEANDLFPTDKERADALSAELTRWEHAMPVLGHATKPGAVPAAPTSPEDAEMLEGLGYQDPGEDAGGPGRSRCTPDP
jgi:arylsulfatase A-like enzyme